MTIGNDQAQELHIPENGPQAWKAGAVRLAGKVRCQLQRKNEAKPDLLGGLGNDEPEVIFGRPGH